MKIDVRWVALMLGCVLAVMAVGGPLTPPSGSVSPTFKTLNDVEPRTPVSQETTPGDASSVFVISQPGSYYMTGPIGAQDGKNGIAITSSGVSLDLGGFEHFGFVFGGATQSGVIAEGDLVNVTVINGSVRAWGGVGLFLASADAVRVENVNAILNLSSGIVVGEDAVVVGCGAHDNGLRGISTSARSSITRCTASNNGFTGFSMGPSGVITECVASDNDSVGIDVGDGTATNCVSSGNSRDGFAVRQGIVDSCIAHENGSNGIRTGSASGSALVDHAVIRNNFCRGNGVIFADSAGISVTGSNTQIVDNLVIGNDLGIQVVSSNRGVTVTGNRAYENATNYSIASGNPFGPIVNVSGAGNLSGVANADHPLANFQR